MNQLEIKELSLQFGGINALNGVSMDVRQGSIHAVIGPNGAGKTSLFNCMSGLYAPTGGEIFFEGQSLSGKKPHQIAGLGLARTFQNIELFGQMTV
ncbi:MAG TPA: ATP-binding cassette domain-containing protein, partial [Thermodesulfobacteriota bacterium]|nr:ATP-binding cassette domain-containing protein [Thermodesulfobacteriota bacterium]